MSPLNARFFQSIFIEQCVTAFNVALKCFTGRRKIKRTLCLKVQLRRLTVLKECVFGESLTEPILKCGS